MVLQPTLRVGRDERQSGGVCVDVRNLDRDLVALLAERPRMGQLLQSVLRVSVMGADARSGDELPDVLGSYQFLECGVRFIPRFPFEPGVRYRAHLDLRPLGRARYTDVLTHEFALPEQGCADTAFVKGVFPSAGVLPENLLRFYVCFSRPMRRGWAGEQISLIGPDGQPAPDVLYRPPLELWDRSMRCLTVLLDPGRLKRWVGPNRELGPPLRVGQRYTLAIGSAMVDSSGHLLREAYYKTFVVGAAVRDPVAVANWKVLPPAAGSLHSLTLVFPRPLDWALLGHAIAVVGDDDYPIPGRLVIERGERQWSFTPAVPWAATRYAIRIASDLEDVCGNNLLSPFDGPLRPGRDLAAVAVDCSIPFELADATETRALPPISSRIEEG